MAKQINESRKFNGNVGNKNCIDERSVSLVMPPHPPGKEAWTKKEKKNWKRGCKKRNEEKGGGGW